jgi:hypothetical protein
MLMGLYSVQDRVAEEFSPPFSARTNGVAVRIYLSMLKDQHVTDYWLYKLGSYDVDTGYMIGNDRPERVKVSDGINELEATE